MNVVTTKSPMRVMESTTSVAASFTRPEITSRMSKSQESISPSPFEREVPPVPAKAAPTETTTSAPLPEQSDSEVSSEDETWDRTGSPDARQEEGTSEKHNEGWDAAEEMNVHEETGEFARFAAQVRGRDLDTVRAEIDDEIRLLRDQRKAAMRDAEDVNQAMVAQIMVSFLSPFILHDMTLRLELCRQCCAFSAFPTSRHPWKQKRNAPRLSNSDWSTV